MAPNREICTFFYEDKGQGDYRCQLRGTSRKQQVGSGYSNLLSHLTSTHHDFEETYRASVATDAPLSSFGQDAEVHIAMFKRVLSLNNKYFSMVAFLEQEQEQELSEQELAQEPTEEMEEELTQKPTEEMAEGLTQKP
ncbi:hypothetical protein PF011_g28451 [Phytophthora fragariae]|uniref:BED-type domain-containing protein n=1 Tax=Phytophthora fragariae TaxID=53985 RepID=A0A6A3H7U6_9STRA|nr:hypothetical protein PF011_g28451 [Phytophthora fragariae]